MTRKIAVISDHASPLAIAGGTDSGGQNIYVASIARELHGLGYDLDIFTRRDNPTLPEVVRLRDGLRVVHVNAGPAEPLRKESMLPLMPQFAARAAEYCRSRGYDLVHANFFMSGLVALRLKQRFGIPFVVTFHALGRVRRLHQREADQFPDERIDIEDRIVEHADAIIAECPQDCVDLISLYGADRDRIRIIPCGFDAREFWPVRRSLARRVLGFGKDEAIVLHLGRIVPRKGVDNVIRALGRLARATGIRPRLVVVGGNSDAPDCAVTPELAALQEIAEAEGVRDQTCFTGRRSREVLKLYYSAADVFVTTPWYEPFGITPLEAMACGTAVIGSAVGGIKHTVVDGVTGYLVPPNDPDALAGRLAHLYRNPALLTRFGHNGLQRVHAHFTWEQVAKTMASLYDEVAPARVPALAAARVAAPVYRQTSGVPAR
ncbi:MAG TPA: glycosyltransferase family 1 protein [Burkholderiales bacterium]|nr:glycosyltransferase family 1 protein [Burkholderiales bacterium]